MTTFGKVDDKQIISDNFKKIEAVALTLEEEQQAILEGKKRKYFKIKNAPYWEQQTKKKL